MAHSAVGVSLSQVRVLREDPELEPGALELCRCGQRLVRSKRGRAVRGAVVQVAVDLDAVPRSALHAATDRDAVVVAVQEHLGERPDAPI